MMLKSLSLIILTKMKTKLISALINIRNGFINE